MTDDVYLAVRKLFESSPPWSPEGGWNESAGRELHTRAVADGWSRVGVPEALNGSGGERREALDVVRAVSATGTPSPLADCLVVAGHLMRVSDMVYRPDAETVVPCVPEDAPLELSGAEGAVSGARVRVPWARWATHAVAPVRTPTGAGVALFALDDRRIRRGENLAGEPSDLVDLEGARPVEHADVDLCFEDLSRGTRVEGALARSVQMTSAMRSTMELTITHARGRVQFGKPLSSFQAIQQYLAEMAGEVDAAEAATRLAVDAEGGRRETAVAVAKVRVGTSAGTVARIAHQVHGAVGVTQEYTLQRFTRSMWAWREEYGSERIWAEKVAAAAHGAEGQLWEWVAGKS